PSWAKRLWALGGLRGRMAAGLINPAHAQVTDSGGEAVSKPGVAGVDTTQRLKLTKPWEGPWMTGQEFQPDPGNLAVRHYRGASGTVRHGETVNPSRNRKSGTETPHLQRGAPDLYPDPYAAFDVAGTGNVSMVEML